MKNFMVRCLVFTIFIFKACMYSDRTSKWNYMRVRTVHRIDFFNYSGVTVCQLFRRLRCVAVFNWMKKLFDLFSQKTLESFIYEKRPISSKASRRGRSKPKRSNLPVTRHAVLPKSRKSPYSSSHTWVSKQ